MAYSWSWIQGEEEILSAPWALCEEIPDDYRVSCASAVGGFFANESTTKRTPLEVARICADAPTEEMALICLERMAQRVVKDAHGDSMVIKKECEAVVSHAAICLSRAFEYMVNQKYGTKNARDLCKDFFGAESAKECSRGNQ